jgi:hypothetical protein
MLLGDKGSWARTPTVPRHLSLVIDGNRLPAMA